MMTDTIQLCLSDSYVSLSPGSFMSLVFASAPFAPREFGAIMLTNVKNASVGDVRIFSHAAHVDGLNVTQSCRTASALARFAFLNLHGDVQPTNNPAQSY